MPPRTRSWLALLACFAASGGVQGQATAPARSQALAPAEPSAAGAAPPADGGLLPSFDGGWRAAPYALSGSLAYEVRATRSKDDGDSLAQLLTTSIGARSYIYEPWFATVSGTLGLTTSRTRRTGGDASNDSPFASAAPFGVQDTADKASERFFTGNGRVDVFPRSRFPFEFHVERSDSRIDSGLTTAVDFQTQAFGFSQRYRPVSGAYTLSGGFDRRDQLVAGLRERQDSLVGDFATRWKFNELSIGLTDSVAHRDDNDDRSIFRSIVARHQYSPTGPLSVSTMVNWTQTAEELTGAHSDQAMLQWSSVGLYHQDGSPLTLSGSGRGLLLREKVTGHSLDSLGATLGAAYEINKNTRLTANGSATTTTSDGTGAQALSGSAAASWQADTIQFAGMRYDPFVSGSVSESSSNGSTLGDETQTSLGLQLGHTLSRSWELSRQSSFTLNGGQSLSAAKFHTNATHLTSAPLQESLRVLLQNVAATWNANGDNRNAFARFSYSDARELGGEHSRFQLFNFQLSGNFEFDRNRTLGGDLTFQRSRQRTSDQPQLDGSVITGERTASRGASGEIVYRHQRLFGVPRLLFTSRLKLAQDVLNQPGTIASIPDRETRLWENRLDWSVGRLDTQLVLRFSQVDHKRRDFLMWRIQRSFD
jgi:hypothetical protein